MFKFSTTNNICEFNYDSCIFRIMCIDIFHAGKRYINEILSTGQSDNDVHIGDKNCNCISFKIVNNLFEFTIYDENYDFNIVEFTINYNENKTEIDKFLNYLLENN